MTPEGSSGTRTNAASPGGPAATFGAARGERRMRLIMMPIRGG